MAYEKNRRRPQREDDGTLIEGRNAVLETLRAGRAVDRSLWLTARVLGMWLRKHGGMVCRWSPATAASSTT